MRGTFVVCCARAKPVISKTVMTKQDKMRILILPFPFTVN